MINNSNLKIYETNEDTVLRDCKTILCCKRGLFYPNKNFGSLISGKMRANEILSAARQALVSVDGVYVKSIVLNERNAEICILINDNERVVNVEFE